MNLLLYIESRTTLAELRAAALEPRRPCDAPHPLAYPDEVYEDAGLVAQPMPSAYRASLGELFAWQPQLNAMAAH